MKSNKLNLRTRGTYLAQTLLRSPCVAVSVVCLLTLPAMFDHTSSCMGHTISYGNCFFFFFQKCHNAENGVYTFVIRIAISHRSSQSRENERVNCGSERVTRINTSVNVDSVRLLPHYCKRTVDKLGDYYERCQELVRIVCVVLIVSYSLWNPK
jgi:hypothetical protein